MPPVKRLGFMIIQNAVCGFVSGLFSRKIAFNKWIAFPTVLLAQFCGIVLFIILSAIFQTLTKVPMKQTWESVQSGMIGNFLQAIIVPFATIAIAHLVRAEGEDFDAIP